MAEWKGGTGQTIQRLYAWIATEEDGGEGVVTHEVVIDWRTMIAPLVGADRARIESFRPLARNVARISGRPVRLIEFSSREVLEDSA
jgi:hypothetical protein